MAWGENGNTSTAGAQGQASTSFGYGTTAAGDYSTSFGKSTKASGNNSTAWGELTSAEGENSTAFGKDSIATGDVSTAFGTATVAKGKNATAFGDYAHTDGENATAFGHRTQANAKNATAFGDESKAEGENSTAFGKNNTASGVNSVAFGDSTQANGKNSTAFGHLNKAEGENATAFGHNTSASKLNSTAFGNGTQATGENSLAGGNQTSASGVNSASLGNSTAATGQNALSLGNGTRATGDNSISAGVGSIASGRNSVAINANSTAEGNNSFAALGGTTKGDYSLAVGQTANAGADYTYAIGYGAQTSAEHAIAVGNNAKAHGVNSIAIGTANTVSGISSGAIGQRNTVTQNNTYVVGNNITSTQANSVILGNHSTDRTATTENTATVNDLTYSGFAGQGSVTNGVVSVGSGGAERQLINVAAGNISANSTDAINGSQLYAVANTVGNMARSTVSVLGGNASVDNGGNITMSDIGGTGVNTVNDAVKAAYDKEASVTAGSSNIVVTGTTKNSTGGTEYVVDVAKDLSIDSVTTGNTVVNNNGVSVNGNTYVSGNGLNANNQKITNVAPGDISMTSTDAINGSQLYDVINNSSWNIASGVDNVTANNATNNTYMAIDNNVKAGDTVAVNAGRNIEITGSGKTINVAVSDKPIFNTVTTTTVNAGSVTADSVRVNNGPAMSSDGLDMNNKKISNVAPGTVDTDAVNVGQLRNSINNANANVRRVDRKLRAGIAQAGAMANIPQVTKNGASGVGVGVANYRNENAIAVGYSRSSDNGKHIIKLSAGADSRGYGMTGAGYMYQW